MPIHRSANVLATGVRTGVLEDLEAFGAEDLVEAVDELAAAVTYQSLGVGELVAVADEQVAGCLCGPGAGRVGGDAGVDHLSGVDVDEEQDVVAAQERGVDGEEVAGDRGLGVEELGPGHVGSVGGRGRCPSGLEDLPDGGLGDLVAKSGEFAVYAAVSPCWVVWGETHDQLAELDGGGWPSGSASGWLCPVSGDAFAVPAEQCLWCDDPVLSHRLGKGCCDRSEQGSVVLGDCGPGNIAT